MKEKKGKLKTLTGQGIELPLSPLGPSLPLDPLFLRILISLSAMQMALVAPRMLEVVGSESAPPILGYTLIFRICMPSMMITPFFDTPLRVFNFQFLHPL